jgi:hypothetical protein
VALEAQLVADGSSSEPSDVSHGQALPGPGVPTAVVAAEVAQANLPSRVREVSGVGVGGMSASLVRCPHLVARNMTWNLWTGLVTGRPHMW